MTPTTHRPASARRLVGRSRRLSVIVDMSGDTPQRMTPPLSGVEAHAAYDTANPVPHRVFCAMWVAAWARAEHCPLNIIAGRFEPHCRHNPSDALWAAVAQTAGDLAGAMGVGVPVLRDEAEVARWASWASGPWGGN